MSHNVCIIFKIISYTTSWSLLTRRCSLPLCTTILSLSSLHFLAEWRLTELDTVRCIHGITSDACKAVDGVCKCEFVNDFTRESFIVVISPKIGSPNQTTIQLLVWKKGHHLGHIKWVTFRLNWIWQMFQILLEIHALPSGALSTTQTFQTLIAIYGLFYPLLAAWY